MGDLRRYADVGRRGAGWYRRAWSDIKRYAVYLGYDPERLADLLSLFSPRVSVNISVHYALFYNETGRFPRGVMGGVRAAVRHWEATKIIRGPKTSAFARALKGDDQAVVLDTWMAKALGVDQREFKGARYREFAEEVGHEGGRIGLAPAEMQAAVWCGVVRSHGKQPGVISLFDHVPSLYMGMLHG